MQQRHPDDFLNFQKSSQQPNQQQHNHNNFNQPQSNNLSSSKSTTKQTILSKFIQQITPQVLRQMKNYLQKYRQPPYNLWNSINDPHKISLFQDIIAIVYLKEHQQYAFSNHQNLRKIIQQIANQNNRKYITVEQRLKKKLSHLSNLALSYLIKNNKELKCIGNSRKFNVQGWPQNVVLSLYQNQKEKFYQLSRNNSIIGGLDLEEFQNQQQRQKRLESRKKQEQRVIKRRFEPLNKNLLQQNKQREGNKSNQIRPTISVNTMIKNKSQLQSQTVFKQSKNSTNSTQVSQRYSQKQIKQKNTNNYTQKTHQKNNQEIYENQFQQKLNEWKYENNIKVMQEQRNIYFQQQQDIVDRDQQRGQNSLKSRKRKDNPYMMRAFQCGIEDYNNKNKRQGRDNKMNINRDYCGQQERYWKSKQQQECQQNSVLTYEKVTELLQKPSQKQKQRQKYLQRQRQKQKERQKQKHRYEMRIVYKNQQQKQIQHNNSNNNNRNKKLRNPLQILYEMGRKYQQEDRQQIDTEINELIQMSMKVSNLLHQFNQYQSQQQQRNNNDDRRNLLQQQYKFQQKQDQQQQQVKQWQGQI